MVRVDATDIVILPTIILHLPIYHHMIALSVRYSITIYRAVTGSTAEYRSQIIKFRDKSIEQPERVQLSILRKLMSSIEFHTADATVYSSYQLLFKNINSIY